MWRRPLGWGLALAILVVACGGSSEEGSCAAPRLLVNPVMAHPGDEVTVTWGGLTECDGEALIPWGGVDVAIATWPPDFTEPIEPPELVVPYWAAFSFGEFDRSGTARLPGDLPSGQYYLVALDFVMSDRFVVR